MNNFKKLGNGNKEVEKIAKEFSDFLKRQDIVKQIAEVNKLGHSSKEVEKILTSHFEQKGFESGKKNLVEGTAIKPDFYQEENKILVEVERGKTLANNMDLLDVWKTHSCSQADWLFLVVPLIRYNTKGKKQEIFNKVVERVSNFYKNKKTIDIKGIFIFSY